MTVSATAECWSAEVGGIRLVAGPHAAEEVGREAGELASGRAFVVTDPGVRACGHAATAANSLIASGFEVEVYDRVGENPSSAEVSQASEAARLYRPDLLVAVGGGSSMDVAKGVNFLLTNGGRMEDYWGFGKAEQPMLPSIAMPATAGTGSDAQSYCLVSGEDGRKMACGDRKARFRTVLLDPAIAATAPPAVAAAAGLDAVSHAVESLVTTRRTEVSTTLAVTAFERLDLHLESYLAAPENEVAAVDALLGAHLAGAAIEESMLGAAHAAANPLTARFGITHGVAVSMMLPHVVRFNTEAVAEDYAGLLAAVGVDPGPDPGETLALKLEALRNRAGLPGRLSEVDVGDEVFAELAQAAAKEWTGGFNPRPVTESDFVEFYRAAR